MVKDPICGMTIDAKVAEKKGLFVIKDDKPYYFCSKKCMDEFKNKGFKGHAVSYILSIILVAVAVGVYLTGNMLIFMGIVFGILAGLKFLDLKGFAKMFSQYDIIASKSKAYGRIYPFIEGALSLMYLFAFQIKIAAVVTVVIMSVGAVGVGRNMLSKNRIQCACLGTKIKVPLTTFTFVEDIVMAVMGIMILFLL